MRALSDSHRVVAWSRAVPGSERRWAFIDAEGGLYLRPRDLARIAYLFLKDGQWDGRALISSSSPPDGTCSGRGWPFAWRWIGCCRRSDNEAPLQVPLPLHASTSVAHGGAARARR
jgi:CubicO group peptidase (beta-lactamase class C family)